MAKKGLELVLVVAAFVVAASLNSDPCGLKQVRDCGQCPWSRASLGAVGEQALLDVRMVLGDSVLVATLTDVIRLPQSYLMLLEMPGVISSDDVKVEVRSEAGGARILSIQGLVQEPVEPRLRRERGAETKLFARKFELPSHVDPEKIRYELRHGLLRLTLDILPGYESTVDDVQTGTDEETWGVLVQPRARYVSKFVRCRAEDAHRVVDAEPLLGSAKPKACDESCVVSVMPLADVVEKEDGYQVVWEMAGVESAAVEVECHQGELPPSSVGNLEFERGSPGCMVTVVGEVEEGDGYDEQAMAVRVERGQSKRKVFSGSFYFLPDQVSAQGMTHHLSHGLLRVNLPHPSPRPPRAEL